jgi:hypothetical protein
VRKNGMRYLKIKWLIRPNSTGRPNGYFWMKVMTEVKVKVVKSNAITNNIIKRSIAFPRRTPLFFSTRKTMLRPILSELKTHVEVQINPPMPSIPTIFRSRMILKMFFITLGSNAGTAFSK